MDKKSANKLSRILALIALAIALYNAYLEWLLDKPYHSSLSILVLVFVLLSVLAAEYAKKQNR